MEVEGSDEAISAALGGSGSQSILSLGQVVQGLFGTVARNILMTTPMHIVEVTVMLSTTPQMTSDEV